MKEHTFNHKLPFMNVVKENSPISFSRRDIRTIFILLDLINRLLIIQWQSFRRKYSCNDSIISIVCILDWSVLRHFGTLIEVTFVKQYYNDLHVLRGNNSFLSVFFVFTKIQFTMVITNNRSEMYLEWKGSNPNSKKFPFIMTKWVWPCIWP